MASLPPPSPSAAPRPEPAEGHDASAGTPVDLDRIAQDLADVEVALERLDDGTYWTCEVTGEPLPDDLLATDPVARRRPPADEAETALAPVPPGSATTTW